MPHKAQGCAGWARNPKGPKITPFCHQLGRHPTVLDATSAEFRQISARRSLGGSRPLNLNFFFHHFGAKNAQIQFFGKTLKMDTPSQGRFGSKNTHIQFFVFFLKMDTPSQGGFGRIWAPRGPRGPKGPQGAPWGPMGPPWAPMGAQGAQGALFTGDFPIALRGLLGGAREGRGPWAHVHAILAPDVRPAPDVRHGPDVRHARLWTQCQACTRRRACTRCQA